MIKPKKRGSEGGQGERRGRVTGRSREVGVVETGEEENHH